jgi:RND family efflux transporter MFP subunit
VGVAVCTLAIAGCNRGAQSASHDNGATGGKASAQTPQNAAGQRSGPGGRSNVVTLAAADVTPVRRGNVEDAVSITGNLQPVERVEVRARLEGELESVLVREGETVKPGQLLARFEDNEQESLHASGKAEVAAAETDVSTARWNLEQTRELFKEGAVPERDVKAGEQQVAAASARLAAAQARLRSSAQALSDTRVVAPATAVVERRLAANGEHVNRGVSLFTLVRTESLELTGAVPAREANRVQAGMVTRFLADGREFTGRVARVSPTIDQASRSVSIYIQIPNADGSLKGGTFATGRIVGNVAQDALIVPSHAVRQEVGTGAPYVYLIEGESIERRAIQLGIIDEATGIAEVTQGLKEGDRIVTGTVGTIANNAKVVIIGGEVRSGGPPPVPRN